MSTTTVTTTATTATDEAMGLPVGPEAPTVSYGPTVLEVPGRPVPLEVQVTAPATGVDLPVILLSHGHGGSRYLSSMRGYAPLVDPWAAQGFVVVRPTHLDSGTLGLREADHPDAPLYARSRAEDMHHVLDHLDELVAAVPGLAGRVDRDRVAVAGHSLGGHTTGLLLGAQMRDPADGSTVDLRDERIRAGVVMAAPGSHDLAEWAATNYPVLGTSDFTTMTTPALVVAGDADLNPMFSERLSYRWDAYSESPGPKHLLMVHGGEHMLGGVSGYDADETTDEDPARVTVVRAVAAAYLRHVLDGEQQAWEQVHAVLSAPGAPATLTSK